jgi:hypothetical protein
VAWGFPFGDLLIGVTALSLAYKVLMSISATSVASPACRWSSPDRGKVQ